MRRLEGGCQTPLAAHAILDGDSLFLRGLVASVDGTTVLRAERRGADPVALGEALADELLAGGATRAALSH